MLQSQVHLLRLMRRSLVNGILLRRKQTLGALNTAGDEILKQLFRFAAKRLAVSLRLTVVELGHAICSVQFRKQF